MAQKRALVVDDSRSARVALGTLLERHGLLVDFAESGEAAIDFLKHQPVDVIFMDHSMPGMDGFEAVSVIKADPRTAMIPVMMYTAKEGEVYVGQARALGAVGVLPKQVHPGVLFDMLHKLGLVQDRRTARQKAAKAKAEAESAAASAPQEPAYDETDRLLERQALASSVQALIKRTLEDQHLELRSDILASNRDFAKRVADDLWARQRAELALLPPEPPPRRGAGGGVLALVLLIGLLPAAVLLYLSTGLREEADSLRVENATLRAASAMHQQDLQSLRAELDSSTQIGRQESDARNSAVLESLQWAVNQGNQVAFSELPFDDTQLERLRQLLARLEALGFRGTLRLDSHLGEFCLVPDPGGGYRLADDDLSVLDCALVGHPRAAGSSPGELQSLAFANFLATYGSSGGRAIEVELFAHDGRNSVRRYAFPPGLRTAGEWNTVAGLNNRVEFTFLADD